MEKDTQNTPHSLAEGFRRTLTYRPIVGWLYRCFLIISLASFFGFIFLILSYLNQNDPWLIYCASFAMIASSCCGLFAIFAMRPLVDTKLHISPEKMILEKKTKRKTIEFQDVQALEVKENSFGGVAIFITLENGKKLRFSSLLERCDYLIHNIANFKPTLLTPEKLKSFIKSTVKSDHAWARIHDNLVPLEKLLLYQLSLALVMTLLHFLIFKLRSVENIDVIYWVNFYAGWLCLSIYLSIVGNLTLEYYYHNKIRDNSQEIEIRRNMTQEKNLHFKMLSIQILLAVIFVTGFAFLVKI